MRPGLDEGNGFDGSTYIGSIGPDLHFDEVDAVDGYTEIASMADESENDGIISVY